MTSEDTSFDIYLKIQIYCENQLYKQGKACNCNISYQTSLENTTTTTTSTDALPQE